MIHQNWLVVRKEKRSPVEIQTVRPEMNVAIKSSPVTKIKSLFWCFENEQDVMFSSVGPSNPAPHYSNPPCFHFSISSSKEPSQQRVRKWGFSLEEALKDPTGQDLFLKFLESEFSSENLRWARRNRIFPNLWFIHQYQRFKGDLMLLRTG